MVGEGTCPEKPRNRSGGALKHTEPTLLEHLKHIAHKCCLDRVRHHARLERERLWRGELSHGIWREKGPTTGFVVEFKREHERLVLQTTQHIEL